MRLKTLIGLLIISFPALAHEENASLCPKANTTVEIVDCLHDMVKEKEEVLRVLETEILARLKQQETDLKTWDSALSDTPLVATFEQTKIDFENYKKSMCEHARHQVLGGTAMPINVLSCQLTLIEDRIKNLNNFSMKD